MKIDLSYQKITVWSIVWFPGQPFVAIRTHKDTISF